MVAPSIEGQFGDANLGSIRQALKKIGFADKSGIPYALIIGGDEAAAGVVSVKDMSAGTQEKLTPAEAGEKISAALDARRECRLIRE